MKLKDGFITHEMDGEQIMVSTGDVRFSGLVRSNATAAYIIDCLKQETTLDEITDRMMARYEGVSRERIEKDAAAVIDRLRGIGAIEE